MIIYLERIRFLILFFNIYFIENIILLLCYFISYFNYLKILKYIKCSKNEYIKIIDDYFTRYGYKVNSLKKPNTIGRTIFNYIEIESTSEIGYGEVPSKAMDIINNACRKRYYNMA